MTNEQDWATIEAAIRAWGNKLTSDSALAALARLKSEHARLTALVGEAAAEIRQLRTLAAGQVWHKPKSCTEGCCCSQDLPHGLQSCRCKCHPANGARLAAEVAPRAQDGVTTAESGAPVGVKSEYDECHSDLIWTGSGYVRKPDDHRVAQLEERVRVLEEALRDLFTAIEMDDVPGYIYDQSVAECAACDRSAPTIEEVKHERGCFQLAIEMARAALSASPPGLSPLEAAVVRWHEAKLALWSADCDEAYRKARKQYDHEAADLLRFGAEIAARGKA